MWVVVKITVPFWIPIIIRHLIFRVPKRDHHFDNHACSYVHKIYAGITITQNSRPTVFCGVKGLGLGFRLRV